VEEGAVDGYYPAEGFWQRPCRPGTAGVHGREYLKAGAAAETTCLQLMC